jgi:hypothetical protein
MTIGRPIRALFDTAEKGSRGALRWNEHAPFTDKLAVGETSESRRLLLLAQNDIRWLLGIVAIECKPDMLARFVRSLILSGIWSPSGRVIAHANALL